MLLKLSGIGLLLTDKFGNMTVTVEDKNNLVIRIEGD